MKFRYLCTLLACASVSLGIAGVSIWQGGPQTEDKIAAVVVALVLGWTIRAVWRDDGPQWHAEEEIYGS